MKLIKIVLILFFPLIILSFSCSKKTTPGNTPTPEPPVIPPAPTVKNQVDFWLTKGDKSVLLQKQNDVLAFGTPANININIDVDSTTKMQTIDGFAYTLTDGSVSLINGLDATTKANLLQELFGNSENSISISYLRISIGASDLSDSTYTYDDMPAGQTDENLEHFSLATAKAGLIPLLKEILAINPKIKILGSPWSAPVWMKDNNSFKGGSL